MDKLRENTLFLGKIRTIWAILGEKDTFQGKKRDLKEKNVIVRKINVI